MFHNFVPAEAEKFSEIMVWWRKNKFSKFWCDGDNMFS